MVDSKISALTNYTTPISTDVLPIVDVTAGASKKVTVANLFANAPGITCAGNLIFTADNTRDIGASGATRPRNVYVANNVIVGGDVQATADVVIGAARKFLWTGRSKIYSPADGQVQFSNNADSGPSGTIEAVIVSAKTSAYPVVALDSNKLFTNEGAGAGVTFTLPTPAAGLTYTFVVAAAQALTIVPATPASEAIYVTTLDANDSIASSTVGHSITLTAINATTWVAVAVVGTWP